MSEHTNGGSVNMLPPTGVAVNIGLYLPTSTSPVEMVAIDNIVKGTNEEIFLFRNRQKTTFLNPLMYSMKLCRASLRAHQY